MNSHTDNILWVGDNKLSVLSKRPLAITAFNFTLHAPINLENMKF